MQTWRWPGRGGESARCESVGGGPGRSVSCRARRSDTVADRLPLRRGVVHSSPVAGRAVERMREVVSRPAGGQDMAGEQAAAALHESSSNFKCAPSRSSSAAEGLPPLDQQGLTTKRTWPPRRQTPSSLSKRFQRQQPAILTQRHANLSSAALTTLTLHPPGTSTSRPIFDPEPTLPLTFSLTSWTAPAIGASISRTDRKLAVKHQRRARVSLRGRHRPRRSRTHASGAFGTGQSRPGVSWGSLGPRVHLW